MLYLSVVAVDHFCPILLYYAPITNIQIIHVSFYDHLYLYLALKSRKASAADAGVSDPVADW